MFSTGDRFPTHSPRWPAIMKPDDLQTIPIENLAIAFVPVLVVLVILYRWAHDVRTPLLAVVRMLAQLLLV